MTARRTAMPTSALDAGSQQIEMSPTSQGRAIASGAAHFDWELSPTLRLFMGLGCLAYWLDAYVLWRVGFAIPSVIFVIVALCSACADAVRPQGEWGRLARQIDRLWGTGALIMVAIINAVSWLSFLAVLTAIVSSLFWLYQSRKVSTWAPDQPWVYVLVHSTWHVWGAVSIVIVTSAVHGGSS
mmetsp:Transcript_70878/g.148270  ORF Transcript_70878/g.148270 Transcript_70878/m.148270 type:complete len:184 (-) Transcript_70878:99-650(-)